MFFLFKNILFIKEKDIKDVRATFGLMQITVEVIFKLCELVLYFVVASMIYGVWNNKIGGIFGWVSAFVLWVFARIFRVALFEIDKIRDGNLMIALFSGVLSFVAVVIAIVALFL